MPIVMRAARTIQRTVQSQARIIDDLLDMSRTNTGKLTLNRVPLLLVEAIQPCLSWALVEARAKGVRLFAEGLDEPIVVDGDAVRVEQIAWNLLSNAVKFSSEGGKISVRVARDGDDALLEVERTRAQGSRPRFPAARVRDVQAGRRGTTRGEGGLGIGLALVKNLVEMHGGRVEALVRRARPGRDLPRLAAAAPAHRFLAARSRRGGAADARSPARASSSSTTRPTRSRPSPTCSSSEGAVVTTAAAASARSSWPTPAAFDLVISDVGMPGWTATTLIAELRRRPGTARAPAIALTGYGRPQDVQQALVAGFQAHVDKPVDFAHMREVIEKLLAGAPTAGTPASKQA